MPFSPLVRHPNLVLARSGGLLVSKFGTVTDVATLEALAAAQRDVVKAVGHVTSVAIVTSADSMGKVSDEVKQKSVEMVRAIGKDLTATATVILGKGMGATIIRTFMTGFNLLVKSPSPQKSFSSVDDALVWLATLPRAQEDLKGVDSASLLRHFELDSEGRKAA